MPTAGLYDMDSLFGVLTLCQTRLPSRRIKLQEVLRGSRPSVYFSELCRLVSNKAHSVPSHVW